MRHLSLGLLNDRSDNLLLLWRLDFNFLNLLRRLCDDLCCLDFWWGLLDYDLWFWFLFDFLNRYWLWLLNNIFNSLYLFRLLDFNNFFFRLWSSYYDNGLILNFRGLSSLYRYRLRLPYNLNALLPFNQRSNLFFNTRTRQLTHDHFILVNNHDPRSLPHPVVLLHLRKLRARSINLDHACILTYS